MKIIICYLAASNYFLLYVKFPPPLPPPFTQATSAKNITSSIAIFDPCTHETFFFPPSAKKAVPMCDSSSHSRRRHYLGMELNFSGRQCRHRPQPLKQPCQQQQQQQPQQEQEQLPQVFAPPHSSSSTVPSFSIQQPLQVPAPPLQ